MYILERKFLFPLGVLLLLCNFVLGETSTVAEDARYSWAANVGWTNWRYDNDDNKGAQVEIDFLSGFVYGENVGWIHLGDGAPDNGFVYSQASGDYGVNLNLATGNLSGFAYGANIGWISFSWATMADAHRPRIDLGNGEFRGYAYSANCGWINLGAETQHRVQTAIIASGADSDNDNIPDSWEARKLDESERAYDLSEIGGDDSDGDGVSDFDEYKADSNPFDTDDFLRITLIELESGLPAGPEVTLEWTSSERRWYDIEGTHSLEQAFTTSGLPVGLQGEPVRTDSIFAEQAGMPRAFYRVISNLPLAD